MTVRKGSWGSTLASGLLALAAAHSANAAQSAVIQFNPTGNGAGTGVATVAAFDWTVGNLVALRGNPANGLTVGSKVDALAHARLGLLLASDGASILLPANVEITFVAGFGEKVVACTGTPCSSATFAFDGGNQNFFEIWVKTTPPDAASNPLAGTGYNTTRRILTGTVNDASGSFALNANGCGSNNLFDQFLADDWAGKQTVCGTGATEIAVQIFSADPDYFPDFTPDKVANIKSKFTTQNVLPFVTTNPSRQFISDEDPGAAVIPVLGAVNGQPPQTGILDFQFQADPNQTFEVGTTVPGACRVTYGGNDRNGNITPNSFGSACMKATGNTENCYTFGGQVGAPTANPALGGPFGEHTHHQVSGPAGDFVFHAGTHSSLKSTRITATQCYDAGACRQAEANAGFKQIDFEGTGSFRTLDPVAKAYLAGKAGHPVLPDHDDADHIYYFRVDMDDTGEPGNKPAKGRFAEIAATRFLASDQNLPLGDPLGDPLLATFAACNELADVYQFFICKDENRCDEKNAIYSVRGYLTGGNIQLHKIIK